MAKLVDLPKTVLLPHTGKTQLWLHSISTYWFSKAKIISDTKSFQIQRKGISLLQRVLHSNALELVNHTQKWFFFCNLSEEHFYANSQVVTRRSNIGFEREERKRREKRKKVARARIEPTAAAPSQPTRLDVSRSNHWAGSRLLFLSSLSKEKQSRSTVCDMHSRFEQSCKKQRVAHSLHQSISSSPVRLRLVVPRGVHAKDPGNQSSEEKSAGIAYLHADKHKTCIDKNIDKTGSSHHKWQKHMWKKKLHEEQW